MSIQEVSHSQRSAQNQAQAAVTPAEGATSARENVEERRIILLGKLGAGKSHSGNGIIGIKNHFKSKQCWSSVTRQCEYGVSTRNGYKYRVFDTPGVNSPKRLQEEVDVDTEIRRCLFCTSPGFHALVLVLSATERLSKEDIEMLDKLDKLLGEKAYKYMIIVVTKLENDESILTDMIASSPEVSALNVKCEERRVIFGDDKKNIPNECLEKFDEVLTELIKENTKRRDTFYKHKYYDKATRILELDKNDYMKKHPEVSQSEAMEIVRNEAAVGRSPRDSELRTIADGCCVIS